MKVIENKDCRVITVTMQGIVITEYSGVIIQIDQSVIKRAAEELGLTNQIPVYNQEDITKLQIQLESALATCKKADEIIKEKDANIEELRSQRTEFESVIEMFKQQNASLKEQYDNNCRTFDKEKAQLWEVISNKDRSIESLHKDIDSGNQLINELEFQRNSARDSVAQLEKQVEDLLTSISEKNEIIGKLSKRIEDDTTRV